MNSRVLLVLALGGLLAGCVQQGDTGEPGAPQVPPVDGGAPVAPSVFTPSVLLPDPTIRMDQPAVVGSPVRFHLAPADVPPDAQVLWQVGDTVAVGLELVHVFPTAGAYEVLVLVLDPYDRHARSALAVQVEPPPAGEPPAPQPPA